jgi:hypothetical protein
VGGFADGVQKGAITRSNLDVCLQKAYIPCPTTPYTGEVNADIDRISTSALQQQAEQLEQSYAKMANIYSSFEFAAWAEELSRLPHLGVLQALKSGSTLADDTLYEKVSTQQMACITWECIDGNKGCKQGTPCVRKALATPCVQHALRFGPDNSTKEMHNVSVSYYVPATVPVQPPSIGCNFHNFC